MPPRRLRKAKAIVANHGPGIDDDVHAELAVVEDSDVGINSAIFTDSYPSSDEAVGVDNTASLNTAALVDEHIRVDNCLLVHLSLRMNMRELTAGWIFSVAAIELRRHLCHRHVGVSGDDLRHGQFRARGGDEDSTCSSGACLVEMGRVGEEAQLATDCQIEWRDPRNLNGKDRGVRNCQFSRCFCKISLICIAATPPTVEKLVTRC